MSKVAAFGIPVFAGNKQSKKPPVIVQEINARLDALGLTADDVISIQAEQELFHVFYRAKEKTE